MATKIKYIFSDIDGVLTDGTVSIDSDGCERKSICYRDLDAIGIGRRAELDFAFITGEDTSLAHFIARRFKVTEAIFGAKDKEKAINDLATKLNVSLEEVCYIGDSISDLPALRLAKIGVAPADAVSQIKEIADVITRACGGRGVLLEAVENVVAHNSHANKDY